MGKFAKYIVAVAVVITSLQAQSVSALAFSGLGSGTMSDPYQIRTCSQLQEIPQNITSVYKLMNDIDCNGATWEPIGFYNTDPFTGILDGDGYTVSNISYSGNGPAGIFGYVVSATIRDLTVSDSVFDSVGHVGGIAGDATSSSLTNVHVRNTTVTADNRLGGIVGIMNASAISDSSVVDGIITGKYLGFTTASIGGAVGDSTGSAVHRVSVAGTVIGNESTPSDAEQVGGFIGKSVSDAIRDSYTTASVSGGSKIGGFIGTAASTSVQRSWTSSAVLGTTDVGGFYGYEGLSTADDSFAMGAVTGTANVGGFIGHAVAIGSALPTAFWDVDRSGVSDCVGLDESLSYATTCSGGVNAGGAAPNYFFNTSTNIPLNDWDFSTVWRTTTSTPKLITSPGRPDNVRVTRGANSLAVSWDVPADTGGGAITSYDLKYRKLDGTNYTYHTALAPSSSNNLLLTSLDPDTWYLVEIRAVNARGKGTWIGFITSTNPANTSGTASTTSSSSTTQNTAKKTTALTSSGATDDQLIEDIVSGQLKEQPPYSAMHKSPKTMNRSGSDAYNDTTSSIPVAGVLFVSTLLVVGSVSLVRITRGRA